MIEDELLAKIKAINTDLTSYYPIDHNLRVDPRIVITVGWLITTCRECLDAIRDDRNLRLSRLRGFDPPP